MSENRFHTILEDCIARLADGESVADCIQRYPDYAADLEILLESGLLARRAQISDAEVALSQARVADRFEAALSSPLRRNTRSRRWWRGLVLAAALFMLLLITNVVLAQDSIPGDWDYSIKRLSESAVILFTRNDQQFMERRFEEIDMLLERGRELDIDFGGEIASVNESGFIVLGLTPAIEASPDIIARLRSNQRVRILANTTIDSHLIARNVEIIEDALIEPEITTSSTALMNGIATATETTSPTMIITATQTVMPTRSPAIEATVVEPTACVVSVPDGWIAYIIQSGDSFFNLAQRRGTSLNRITTVNCIDDPSLISVGQTVYLPVLQRSDSPNIATPVSRPTEQATVGNRPPVRSSATPTLGR